MAATLGMKIANAEAESRNCNANVKQRGVSDECDCSSRSERLIVKLEMEPFTYRFDPEPGALFLINVGARRPRAGRLGEAFGGDFAPSRRRRSRLSGRGLDRRLDGALGVIQEGAA
jgi:hypothetical protein